MRLPGENEYSSSGLSMKYMMMGVSLCLALILGAVALTNKEDKAKKQKEAQQETTVLALEHEESGQDGAEPANNDDGAGAWGESDTEAGSAGTAGNGVGTGSVIGSLDAANSGGNGDGTGKATGGLEAPSYAEENSSLGMSAAEENHRADISVPAGSGGMNTYAEDNTLSSTSNSLNENTGNRTNGNTSAGNVTSENRMNESAANGNVAAESSSIGNSAVENSTTGSSSTGTVMNFNGGKSLEEVERLYAEKRLVASDLDFWDMYPKTPPAHMNSAATSAAGEKVQDGSGKSDDSTKSKDKYARYDEEAERESQKEAEKEEQDPSKDGKHTLITRTNGEEEWVLINPYLEKNTYDFSKLTIKQNQLASYADGKSFSYVGVDLSKYNGEVDFAALKRSGISYVMIRLGSRGYGSGQIMLDEKFTDYITKAAEAGLDIGIYFYSQAITEAEAVEEANFVIQNLANYRITYPVAFDMEYVPNDTARVEALNREEKTKMAKSFLDTIKNAGYKPMVYGTKEWLMKQVDLTKLTDYDIWLSQQESTPDYPYQFQMWQYSQEGRLNGVDGSVDLNISFVDYSEK